MRSSKTLWDQLDNRQIIRDVLAPTDYEITKPKTVKRSRCPPRLRPGRFPSFAMIETKRPVRILGFAGSLRQGSYNRALLRAATVSPVTSV
jgi:hypothetical protein